VLFNGTSGSGKSTLLLNLLTRKEFLADYFNKIYLFSPTGAADDLFKHLKIKKENIYMDMNPDDLQKIMDTQEKLIAQKGVDKAPRLLIIFEDVQGNAKFMKSKPFLRSFIANRHFGLSTWLCGQSFTRTPRPCRMQANNIFYFRGGGGEKDLMVKEFCPSGMSQRDFSQLIDYATRDKYAFMHINMRCASDERYRQNLDVILKTE